MKMELLTENDVEVYADLKKGQAIILEHWPGNYGLVWGCPVCGKVSTGPHKYSPIKRSLTPSIICTPANGGCGYHGYLTDGIFTNLDKKI